MKKIMLILSFLGVLIIGNAQIEKNELKLTLEITEMVVDFVFKGINFQSDKKLIDFGVKNRSQLMNLQLGKSIPVYSLTANDTLKFLNRWRILVMSDDEPIIFADVILADDGQYEVVNFGAAIWAEHIHNYEHKDLIVGFLSLRTNYLYIQKDNQDIFVEVYDYATREWFKNEYSLSDIINLRNK